MMSSKLELKRASNLYSIKVLARLSQPISVQAKQNLSIYLDYEYASTKVLARSQPSLVINTHHETASNVLFLLLVESEM
jgi:hypothetical protein